MACGASADALSIPPSPSRCSCSSDGNCRYPNLHFWWSHGDCNAPWPPHLIELPNGEYTYPPQGLWLDLDVSGKVWFHRITRNGYGSSAQCSKETKLVHRIICKIMAEGDQPLLLLFHPAEEQPSQIKLSPSAPLLPVMEALQSMRKEQQHLQCSPEYPLSLELPLQLCEGQGRVDGQGSLWRIWTERNADGHVILVARGNGWGPQGKSWSGKLFPVKTLQFDAIGPAIVLQGQKSVDAVDSANSCADNEDASMLSLALPKEATEASHLLDKVRSIAIAASVSADDLPCNLEKSYSFASLSALRQGDAHATHILSDGFFRRGFCFVELDDELGDMAESVLQDAESYLTFTPVAIEAPSSQAILSASNNVSKEEFEAEVETRASTEAESSDLDQSQNGVSVSTESIDDMSDLQLVGHFVDRWKSGVRLLSGDLLEDPKQYQGLPAALSSTLRAVAKELDSAAKDLLQHCLYVFDSASESPESMCTEKGLSLLYDHDLARASNEKSKVDARQRRKKLSRYDDPDDEDGSSDSDSSDSFNERFPRYGIVDCVYYSMARGCPEVVVGAHIDPGLFVLALPQKGQGLQLRDEYGTWVDMPEGKGVIWAGAAAVSTSVRGGEHRVVCHGSSVPRMALWHEVCTYGQLVPPVLELLEERGLELRMGSLRGTAAVMRKLRAAEDHQADDKDSQSNKGRRGIAKGQGAIGIRGVPSAKTGSFGWQRLIGPEALARTSGSWSGGFGMGSQLPPDMVEVVPQGYDLKAPDDYRFEKHGYGTRKYLMPENMRPLK